MSFLFKDDRLISINPATLEPVGEVPVTQPEQVENTVQAARDGFYNWRARRLQDRASLLRIAGQRILERREEIARTITLEMGRPYAESFSVEVEASIDLIMYYTKRAHLFLNERPVPLHNVLFLRRDSRVHFQPLGVLGVICPWNWPLLIPLGVILPALLAGNSVVFKPSEVTPLVGELIQGFFCEAGVPESVFKVIHGDGHVGAALVRSSIDKVFFTGSTHVGQKVMEMTAQTQKKAVLEMGGSDPAIVCDDAELETSASGIVWGGFSNCGQNCNSIERIFVHQNIYNRFLKLLVERTKRLRIGNGLHEDMDIGPLASQLQLKKMEHFIKKAGRAGATIETGGYAVSGKTGLFFHPTVLSAEVPLKICFDEEIFGPVVIVTPVQNDSEAIQFANESAFGLAASVWTGNRKRGLMIARQIEAGSVMINDVIVSFGMTEAGWTGIKQSGIGWVHGEKGLDEMVNIQYINRDPQNKMQKIWWFPYSRLLIDAMKAGMDFLFHRNLLKRIGALPVVLRHFMPYLILNSRWKEKW
jgi:acyl-CoA reductase-like NAD-dependent aldehyde dehydrogenase